jgi:TrmH family RNA methyltransferase
MFAGHITSGKNPKIKQAVALRDRKARDESGLTLVEGIREVRRALQSGIICQETFVCSELLEDDEILLELHAKDVPVYQVTPEVYEKLAYGGRQEGMVAVFPFPVFALDHMSLPEHPLVVIVDGVEKPGNLGAILRTCDAVGVDLVCVCGDGTDAYNPNVIRSSLSAVFAIPVVSDSKEQIAAYLKRNALTVYAADPSGTSSYTSVPWTKGSALAVGNEQNGLSDFWKKAADTLISIPMHGIGDSLNVSVSSAVILYEALRQRASS